MTANEEFFDGESITGQQAAIIFFAWIALVTVAGLLLAFVF